MSANLKVRAAQTSRNLFEQRLHYVPEVLGLDHVENFLELVKEHDLLVAAGLRPIFEQALDHRLGEARVLLDELNHAVSKLKRKGANYKHFIDALMQN